MDDDQHATLSDSTCTTKKTEDRPSHDASIFVGSLPSNVDQGDLSRMLMDHLSEHTQIKNVKVVRDSKGGVCAFVQCLDASSATSLIETLYTDPPKPFMGRILRYEPARAFRTLIISYRAPIHLYPVNHSSGSFKNQPTEIELPAAMQIWKHDNSRFHNILYNAQALRAEENRRPGTSELEDTFFLHPVRYDEETLKSLTSYFGALESFHPIQLPTDGQYPIPHNGPRSSTMDSRCWEVKWQHRDDCVSALMTLRRVPHLTVTWAHQPLHRSPLFQSQHHYASATPSLPFRFHQQHRVPELMSPDVFAHPMEGRVHFEHMNFQSVSYDHQVAMGRGVGHSPQTVANKQSFTENSNVINSKSYFRLRQNRGSVSSLEKETLPEIQDHEPSCPADLSTRDVAVPQISVHDASSVLSAAPVSTMAAASGTSYHNFSMKEDEKQVDPTTLFVGGLNISGSGAWDEEKVKALFSGYGGLESVKVVRPMNATVGFAFVKFNNLESPARAVYEEHNRVYEGRALRVQLRDINPPRGNWKFGRGRGRFLQHNFNPHRRYNNYRPFVVDTQVNTIVTTPESRPGFSLENDDRHSTLSETPHQRTKSLSSDPDVGKETDKYREWYDDLESPHTPAPSSQGSSASVTCASYTTPSYPLMQNVPYPPPPPWMQPYPPNGPYSLPYYPGYAFYPPPAIPQQRPAMMASNSDASGSSVGSVPVWPSGVYGSFVSYPIGPLQVPPVGQPSPGHGSTQAPLMPNGFVQNEHGTLVAVYQPDALNRYISGPGEPPNVAQRVFHSEGAQPSTGQHFSHQGPVGVNVRPFHVASSSQISHHEGTQPMNLPLDPPHRRPPQSSQLYQNYNVGRGNHPGNSNLFPRAQTGRSGRGYLHSTGGPHRGQMGRSFSGDWSR